MFDELGMMKGLGSVELKEFAPVKISSEEALFDTIEDKANTALLFPPKHSSPFIPDKIDSISPSCVIVLSLSSVYAILVTGSLYFVSRVIELITENPSSSPASAAVEKHSRLDIA